MEELLDMIYFKKEGYAIYDFGGYAYGTNNPDLIGINNFKDQFGGELVEESNFSPVLTSIILTGLINYSYLSYAKKF